MPAAADWNVIDRCLTQPVDIEQCRAAILAPGVDWISVVGKANDEFVGQALWTTLSEPELRALLPADVSQYLGLIHARNAERNQRIRRQCLAFGAFLSARGLRAVLLKGTTWLFDGSAEAAADRMMRDIDILVDPAYVAQVVSAMVENGYQDSGQAFTDNGHFHFEDQSHFHHAPLLPTDGEASVEIHRGLSYLRTFVPAEDILRDAVSVAPGLMMPSLQHRILHNVIHAQILNGDFFAGRFDLRDGLDLSRLVRACPSGFDWKTLAMLASSHHAAAALSGALHATHRMLGAPLPPYFHGDRMGRWHAQRCAMQRDWPVLGKAASLASALKNGLSGKRDEYAEGIDEQTPYRVRLAVNARRLMRVSSAIARRAVRKAMLKGRLDS